MLQPDPIFLLKELMQIRGIDVLILKNPYDEMNRFDRGLRCRLYDDYDYSNHTSMIKEYCRDNVVYFATDYFEMSYVIFFSQEKEIFIIGPYVSQSSEYILNLVSDKLQFPITKIPELTEFYHGLPFVESLEKLESEVILLIKYILKTDKFKVERINIDFDKSEIKAVNEDHYDDSLQAAMIERRYEQESILLEAVSCGDLKLVTAYMGSFGKFNLEQRHGDRLRNSKSYCLVLNTLLRKTAQDAAVHPAHIHQISNAFAVRIENVISQSELPDIINNMMRKYCNIVRNHSLREYSLPVRKAINFIDFNYTQQLTLEQIAQAASVNFSYLSTLFKKETGLSVVEYINAKRMEKAIKLLTTTKLTISTIAGKCAFENDSYFTRTFRKIYGKSPREHRKNLQDVK